MTAEPARPILLTSCRQRAEADTIADALRERDIWVYVHDLTPASEGGALGDPYYEIFVREGDWSAAAETVIEYRTGGDGRDHRLPACTKCRYSTRGLNTVQHCPECGADIAEQALAAILRNHETTGPSVTATIDDTELAAQAEEAAAIESETRHPEAPPRTDRPPKLAIAFGVGMIVAGVGAFFVCTSIGGRAVHNGSALSLILAAGGIVVLRMIYVSRRKT
jgi:hypothetical protein